MNSQLLNEIYRAKDERRKRLSNLPVDKKIEIIEQLRDMAIALKAARREFAKRYAGELHSSTVSLPVHTAIFSRRDTFAPVVRTSLLRAANDYEALELAA